MQFYVIYKGSKLGLTLGRPPLVRRRCRPTLSRRCNLLYELSLVTRTHGDWQLHFSTVWPWVVPWTIAPIFMERLPCHTRFVRSRIREAWHYMRIARCMRDIDPREGSRETDERDDGGKSADVRKKKTGDAHKKKRKREGGGGGRRINCTGDADLFERDTLPWYVCDATWRESTSSRYFWATTSLSLDRQCEFPRFDEGISEGYGNSGGSGNGGWKSPGRERYSFSFRREGARGILSHGRISSL